MCDGCYIVCPVEDVTDVLAFKMNCGNREELRNEHDRQICSGMSC